jgi:DNA-binding CsgD family transcriptional regulator
MDRSRFDTLTSRQREALRLLAAPMRPKQVAAAMGLSPRTVEDHLAEATRRVGAGSSLEAARLLAEHERETPVNLRTGEHRIETREPEEAVSPLPVESEPASQGRLITLGLWQRSALIVGLTIGLIFSAFILIAGGESIARILRSETSAPHR